MVAFQMGGGVVSEQGGQTYPSVREMCFHKYVLKWLPMKYLKYFVLLKATLEKSDVMDKPAQNICDEFGMPLEHKMPKTTTAKGLKKVQQRTSGNKNQMTILGSPNAAGQAIPPMIVFSGKNFNLHWVKERSLEHSAECPIWGGWTKTFLLLGSLLTFSSMLYQLYQLYCYGWSLISFHIGSGENSSRAWCHHLLPSLSHNGWQPTTWYRLLWHLCLHACIFASICAHILINFWTELNWTDKPWTEIENKHCVHFISPELHT